MANIMVICIRSLDSISNIISKEFAQVPIWQLSEQYATAGIPQLA